jgi:cell division protein FtsW (lipid II flippase)
MSYGGNSIIVACMVISVLLRIDFENRRLAADARSDGGSKWDR